ncbi:MAG: hypothetical protein KAS36_14030, partial [Anaerolineales bacterium]|nr:hypothetical protein [Anaerolineales bacterium]
MGKFSHGLQAKVTPFSSLPLIVDLQQDRSYQADNRRLIGIALRRFWGVSRSENIEKPQCIGALKVIS